MKFSAALPRHALAGPWWRSVQLGQVRFSSGRHIFESASTQDALQSQIQSVLLAVFLILAGVLEDGNRWVHRLQSLLPRKFTWEPDLFSPEGQIFFSTCFWFHISIGCVLGPDIFIARLNLLQVTRLPPKNQPPNHQGEFSQLAGHEHHLLSPFAGHFMR